MAYVPSPSFLPLTYLRFSRSLSCSERSERVSSVEVRPGEGVGAEDSSLLRIVIALALAVTIFAFVEGVGGFNGETAMV